MASQETRGASPFRNKIDGAVRKGFGPWALPSIHLNRVSPDMSSNTSNVERSTDEDMDEERMAGTANEVQAERGPRMINGASGSPVRPTEFEDNIPKLKT